MPNIIDRCLSDINVMRPFLDLSLVKLLLKVSVSYKKTTGPRELLIEMYHDKFIHEYKLNYGFLTRSSESLLDGLGISWISEQEVSINAAMSFKNPVYNEKMFYKSVNKNKTDNKTYDEYEDIQDQDTSLSFKIDYKSDKPVNVSLDDIQKSRDKETLENEELQKKDNLRNENGPKNENIIVEKDSEILKKFNDLQKLREENVFKVL
jgi:hypothetical protein